MIWVLASERANEPRQGGMQAMQADMYQRRFFFREAVSDRKQAAPSDGPSSVEGVQLESGVRPGVR